MVNWDYVNCNGNINNTTWKREERERERCNGWSRVDPVGCVHPPVNGHVWPLSTPLLFTIQILRKRRERERERGEVWGQGKGRGRREGEMVDGHNDTWRRGGWKWEEREMVTSSSPLPLSLSLRHTLPWRSLASLALPSASHATMSAAHPCRLALSSSPYPKGESPYQSGSSPCQTIIDLHPLEILRQFWYFHNLSVGVPYFLPITTYHFYYQCV